MWKRVEKLSGQRLTSADGRSAVLTDDDVLYVDPPEEATAREVLAELGREADSVLVVLPGGKRRLSGLRGGPRTPEDVDSLADRERWFDSRH